MSNKQYGIGKLVATFGTQGQLILQHALGKKTALTGVTVLMVEVKRGTVLPYFVQSTKVKNDTEIYLTLEDIITKEQAQKLVGRSVLLQEADFYNHVAHTTTISLLGYTIYNNEVMLAEIIEVIEQPHQVLAKIIYMDKEMLIPINEAFMVSTNKATKTVVLNLPDGLLEIYL